VTDASASLDLQLPYGLADDGRLVPIAQVERGLACGCRCPRCDRRLVARKGAIMRHHFAHETAVQCTGAFETMVHLLAKQVIVGASVVFVPPLIARHKGAEEVMVPGRQLTVSDVRVETW
jgi:Competence protein CoiA-like family